MIRMDRADGGSTGMMMRGLLVLVCLFGAGGAAAGPEGDTAVTVAIQAARDVSPVLAEARRDWAAGRRDGAVARCEAALAGPLAGTERAAITADLILFALHRDRLERSFELIEALATVDPDLADVYRVECLARALQNYSADRVRPFVDRAFVRGEPVRFVRFVDRLLALDPATAENRLTLADALDRLAGVRGDREAILRARSLGLRGAADPWPALALLRRSREVALELFGTLGREGRTEEARCFARRAIREFPRETVHYATLFESDQEAWEGIIAAAADPVPVLLDRATRHAFAGHYADAVRLVEARLDRIGVIRGARHLFVLYSRLSAPEKPGAAPLLAGFARRVASRHPEVAAEIGSRLTALGLDGAITPDEPGILKGP